MLIHAPHIVGSKTIDEAAFQIDIGPTLLDILGLSGQYTSFGKSLYTSNGTEKRGMILPNWDGYLVFVYDPYILKLDVDKVHEIYNFRKNKYQNLIDDPSMKDSIKNLHREFLIMYQTVGDAVYNNRIYPCPDTVGKLGMTGNF